MNVLRKEFRGEIEEVRREIKEVREKNKKHWKMEREKQWAQVGLFLHIQAKIKEDLKKTIVNEVPGIVRKVLRKRVKT
ncbi:hypothetical protein KY285_031539 [Solanum tuberosum]|nr:hypothetical protein KY284_031327 [Solanum tuberosum]KAH0656657.1 hypothetical protein KY285_031539 [Solanum tuberosum]